MPIVNHGDQVEMRYNVERAAAAHAAAADRLEFVHVEPMLAVAWKPAGANRAFEEALEVQLPSEKTRLPAATPPADSLMPAEKPEMVFRLSKGVSGLVLVARSAAAREQLLRQRRQRSVGELGGLCCRFRAVVYGRLQTDESRRLLLGATKMAGAADDERTCQQSDNDIGVPMPSLSAVDDGVGVVEVETVQVSRSPSARYLSTVDLWCGAGSSGGRHKRRLCQLLSASGHPVVGDEQAQHAWVKKRGLHMALLELTFTHPKSNELLRFARPPPNKLAATTAREDKAWHARADQRKENEVQTWCPSHQPERTLTRDSETESDLPPNVPEPEPASWDAAEPSVHTTPDLPRPSLARDVLVPAPAGWTSTVCGLRNRDRDRALILRHLPLTEWGQPPSSGIQIYTRSNHSQTVNNISASRGDTCARAGMVLLAVGYERLLFGDHGPYFEFTDFGCGQLHRTAFGPAHPKVHYDEHYSVAAEDGVSCRPAKLYRQKLTVRDKPNPPKEGPYWVANNRADGYADYRIGFCYISCDDVVVVLPGEGCIGHALPQQDIVGDRREALRLQVLAQSCDA